MSSAPAARESAAASAAPPAASPTGRASTTGRAMSTHGSLRAPAACAAYSVPRGIGSRSRRTTAVGSIDGISIGPTTAKPHAASSRIRTASNVITGSPAASQ